jgi:hypothetical protein
MSKKTEMIEVRVAPELKAELASACASRSLSMSEMVRILVEREIREDGTQHQSRRMSAMTRSLLGGTVVLLGLASVASFTQGLPAMAQSTLNATFAEMDQDANGIVTPDEYSRYLTGGRTAALPVTADSGVAKPAETLSSLSAACMAKLTKPLPGTADSVATVAAKFASADSNGDGQLAFGEVQMFIGLEMLASFDRLDADKDGFVAEGEFVRQPGVVEAEGVTLEISRDCMDGLPAGSVLPAQSLRVEFAGLDDNRDGKVSLVEYLRG